MHHLRKQLRVTTVLRELVNSCGIDSSLVASHSLRRGMACCMAAAGIPNEDIQRFGRWNSDAYKLYVMSNADLMSSKLAAAAGVVPNFELH